MPSYKARLIPNSSIPNAPIREHCLVHRSRITTIGRDKGHQVRIKRDTPDGIRSALYTVIDLHDEKQNAVFLGYKDADDLSKRLGLSSIDPFMGKIDSQVTDDSEFTEHLTDNGHHRGLIVIAPHGGDIERYTDEQAERVGKRLVSKHVSLWVCKGFKEGGGAFDCWHITSTDICEESFPRLKEVIGRGFEYAVAFHGWDEDSICIGGSAPPDLKQQIKTAVESATSGSGIVVATDEDGGCPPNFNGNDPRNIVNRLATNGIQIEQSKAARRKYHNKIADAVADIMDPKIQVCIAPAFEGSDFWTCLIEGISDSVLAMSRTGMPSLQCEIKRLQFRIRKYSQGNSDPRIEL